MASAEVTEKPDSEKGLKQYKTQTSVTPDLDLSIGHGHKGKFGAVPKDRERKIGHRRVDETGTVTYKKKPTSELMVAIQLGIGQSVGGLSSKPERDVLMQDFAVVQSVVFPSEGSNMTPAHHCSDFRFKTYAPMAFRHFRELFNIRPDDFMLSLCDDPLNELSNPGAGGSIFYISNDDDFIIKTAQHKEANFLQKLLPGYYLNLKQNPRTLLPKFYGLYCYQCGGKNIRFVVMNNILPSSVKLHEKYDLKGSTYKRKASKTERAKSSPTLKDLDFMEIHPEGLLLEKDTYEALVKTIQRDCLVLESFKIMDYSLLVGIHNLDKAKPEKKTLNDTVPQTSDVPSVSTDLSSSQRTNTSEPAEGKQRVTLARGKSIRTKVMQYSTPMESISAEVRTMLEEFDDEDIPPGGIPAKNAKGERLLIYLGIIDVLQCYRFRKKFEHTMKSMITDGETVSVTRPSFYAERFKKFFTNTVFRKAPSPKMFRRSLKHSPSKRKGTRTTSMNEDPTHIPGTTGARPDLLMGSATPPPTFAEATGARPRDKIIVSPASGVKSADSEVQRLERTQFQTIQQQEDIGRTNIKVRYSPLSVSESTPTYTEFTEGTPSYTPSSPSCSSDVLDSNIPNLPLEREVMGTFQDMTDSPSKTMVTSSSTDASYYSTVSHVDHPEGRENTSVFVSRSDEHFSNNQSLSQTVVVSRRDKNQSVTGDTFEMRTGSLNTDTRKQDGPRLSETSQKTDTSFSSHTTSVDGGYTESIVSSMTTESAVSGQSSESSVSKGDVTVITISDGGVKAEDEGALNEVDESTYL